MSNPPIVIHSAVENRDQTAQWVRVRKLSRWASNRRLRRVSIALWLAVLILDVQLCLIAERRGPYAVFAIAAVLFFLNTLAIRRMGFGLAQPSLEDRAVLTYGEEFDRLREKQRAEVFDQQVRDNLLGRSNEDLRDIDLNTRAQATAWRMVGPVLPLAACCCWLLAHFYPDYRHALRGAGIAAIAFTVLYIALPTIIRLWTEPDPFNGETHLVAEDTQP